MEQDISQVISQISAAPLEQQDALFNLAEKELDDGALALILESQPIEKRIHLWRCLSLNHSVDVLTEMRSDARYSIIQSLSAIELDLVLSRLDNADLIEWADYLPDEIVQKALSLIDEQEIELYDQANEYNDEEIGRYAERKMWVLAKSLRVRHALRLISRDPSNAQPTIYLVDKHGTYYATLATHKLLNAPLDTPVLSLADQEQPALQADLGLLEASELIEHAEYDCLPIVNEHNRLIGQISVRLGMSIIREEYENTLMARAGLSESEDLFAPVIDSAKKRAVWLGINLVTAIFASITIGLFEDVISEVVALAVLMPIVASMGGIAGSQTLTLMIRAMALNQVSAGNLISLIKNECGIGALNGLLWALVIGLLAGLWFQSPMIGAIIALAICINIITAALFGVLIPMVLDKLKLDPALAGSVVLTTVTDVVGFFAFLGTATLLIL
ncbi:magnesium transporter [Motilimonas sp. 1_MG-2023]|uniref:magnesium transporter n=1 Tax=Motilimonas sp. 1_MG-2023 TaxID=3062672 RepID=UPI0026E1D48D|nr:magnesium transporter [Motilimonas sp. 1_MG-2023]MDO6526078.1 magnesium transporter [Motilimonas sp. 1_MG-2023]